ncbi:hypothetical protein [Streptomyces scopuliridis]|uniref:hypothetical protein n=1 Tax=Streptomyces scopuliridis TaxID=452529 RepID=UPI00368F6E80
MEIDGLRYNGDALNDYRNQPSSHRGSGAGKWPIAVDSGDIRKVYFQDPKDHSWHPLEWEHAPAMNGPVSREAVSYARRLALRTHRFPDTKRALVELLERWGAGLTADRTERRMAVRLSQERLRLVGEADVDEREGEDRAVSQLASVRRITELSTPPGEDRISGPAPAPAEVQVVGDDDEDEECEAAFPGEEDGSVEVDEDDFYADVWESR